MIKKVAERLDIETLTDEGETTAENESSVVLLFRVDGKSALFTADAGQRALTLAADILDANKFDLRQLNFIQVPHHGSQRNVGPTILDRLLGPKLPQEQTLRTAFVSVSGDGAPKHPNKKVTNAFHRRGAPVHATSGISKFHFHNSPGRDWGASTPLPFYVEVEE